MTKRQNTYGTTSIRLTPENMVYLNDDTIKNNLKKNWLINKLLTEYYESKNKVVQNGEKE